MRLATDKQVAFIESLIEQRVPEEDQEARLEWLHEGITVGQASASIERLLTFPKLKQAKLPEGVIPGRYAIDTVEGLKFYYIAKSGWMGRKSSDNTLPICKSERIAALTEIARDARTASLAYGKEFGHCGVCGRGLTDEESRAAGIGPVCAENTGWA